MAESSEYLSESSSTSVRTDFTGIISQPSESEEPFVHKKRTLGKKNRFRLVIYAAFFLYITVFPLLALVTIVISVRLLHKRTTTHKVLGIPETHRDILNFINEHNLGNNVLSESLTNEYSCTGSCHCENEEEEERRRRNLAVPSTLRSSVYLAAAVTSFVAYREAKKYFNQVCDDEFSNVCASSVVAEVEECLPRIEERFEQPMLKNKIVPETLYIDVRTKHEFERRTLSVAININYEDLRLGHPDLPNDYNTPIVVFCRTGRRSGIAKTILEAFGYTDVINAGSVQDMKDLYGEI